MSCFLDSRQARLPAAAFVPAEIATSRRGALLICVVVCMSIATALATAGVRSALSSRRQQQVLRQLTQAELLLDAGARRAAVRLRETANYEGETWSLGREVLPRLGPATVEIVVQSSAKDSTTQVLVEVLLPADGPRPVRRRQSFTLSRVIVPTPPEEF